LKCYPSRNIICIVEKRGANIWLRIYVCGLNNTHRNPFCLGNIWIIKNRRMISLKRIRNCSIICRDYWDRLHQEFSNNFNCIHCLMNWNDCVEPGWDVWWIKEAMIQTKRIFIEMQVKRFMATVAWFLAEITLKVSWFSMISKSFWSWTQGIWFYFPMQWFIITTMRLKEIGVLW